MVFCMKCGSDSYYRAAMGVAIIDVEVFPCFVVYSKIYTTVILILFVLGTSLMVGFEFSGAPKNATRVLDELTDDVFGTQFDTKTSKDVAEDMGVFLIIMFLSVVDFIISCIFLDGVKTKNVLKCQAWFNLRLIILVIFDIVVFINVTYGSSWYRCIPDAILTVYRLFGIMIGYAYLQELKATTSQHCEHCHGILTIQRQSVINLSGRRKEIEKAMQDMPIVTVTGPEDQFGSSRRSSGNTSPQVTITRKNSSNTSNGALSEQKAATLFPESGKDSV